jgi:hypothetical protein
VNTIAPVLLTLALTYGTAAALTAATKSAAVGLPTADIVAVTGVLYVPDPADVAEIVNVPVLGTDIILYSVFT